MNVSDKKVLVADDFVSVRNVLKTILKQLGFSTIYEVKDGIDALEIVNSKKLDLVLADWNMPGISGLELLKKIRSNIETESLPVIMITAEVQKTRDRKSVV